MRRTALPPIAAVSLLLALTAMAARRPRYGGTLRVESRAVVRNLDPTDVAVEPLEASLKEKLTAQIFETLVRLDDKGVPQPLLATAWTHDTARKRWVFTARPRVEFHNGAPWAPAGGVVNIPDDKPIEQILVELSRPRAAIVLKLPDGSLAGTGPFRLAQFDPGKQVTLAAHDNHWAGRPYLDTVEIRLGRALREQAVDFELGQTDAIEVPVTDVRRLRQRAAKLSVSSPLEVLALTFDRAANNIHREALALSVDRNALQSVLLQKMGDSSAALLPQWLSGYAFTFPAERNVARARQLAAGAPPLFFQYDRQDPLLQSVADRIQLNAAEAGLTLKPGSGGARLLRLWVAAPDALASLDQIALGLGAAPASTADAYLRERALLDGFNVIPLVHLPACYQLQLRVQGWAGAAWSTVDRWDLGGVWLGEPPR